MPRDKSTHPVLKEVKCASSARAECYALVDPFIITLDHERFVWPTFCGVIFRGCVSGRHPKEQERKQLRIARFGGWETCIRRPSSAREGAHRLGSDALSACGSSNDAKEGGHDLVLVLRKVHNYCGKASGGVEQNSNYFTPNHSNQIRTEALQKHSNGPITYITWYRKY